jgi:hypothetical protein
MSFMEKFYNDICYWTLMLCLFSFADVVVFQIVMEVIHGRNF